MLITKELVNNIKPKVENESDKYSWNLYRLLSKKIGQDVKIYSETENYYQFNTIFITFANDYGIMLSDVMNSKPKSKKIFDFYKRNHYRTQTNLDITDYFFTRYVRDGRCFTVPIVHRYGDRMISKNGIVYRLCEYCGDMQTLTHKVVEEWK